MCHSYCPTEPGTLDRVTLFMPKWHHTNIYCALYQGRVERYVQDLSTGVVYDEVEKPSKTYDGSESDYSCISQIANLIDRERKPAIK